MYRLLILQGVPQAASNNGGVVKTGHLLALSVNISKIDKVITSKVTNDSHIPHTRSIGTEVDDFR